MTTPAPLTIDKNTGKLHSPDGAINILYSNPFPIPFSKKGVTGTMRGAVEHTTDCAWQVAVNTFQSPNAKGSAHFLVGSSAEHDGDLMQFVPLGFGYITYHAFDANLEFYGIEHEDQGDLEHHAHADPISDKGLWTSALVMEFLSRYAGFPLQLLIRENGHGFGYHRQFANWNRSGHTCPGATMTDDVRRDQRDNIINRAGQIRDAGKPAPRTPGHVAYAAHGSALSWTDPVSGLDIPFWASARRSEQLAWEAAAKAVTK
jgi:N-acetylmuramoyl-L-alanine amidase